MGLVKSLLVAPEVGCLHVLVVKPRGCHRGKHWAMSAVGTGFLLARPV